MPLNITAEVAELQEMTVTQLRRRYEEVIHEETRSGNKVWLIKRIAWRLQANVEGDLSQRARNRALEIANDADLRLKAPKQTQSSSPPQRTRRGSIKVEHDSRLPVAGMLLERKYKGNVYRITVLEDGFEYAGEKYKSLSAVAKEITGSHWNGYLFFGLRKKGGA